MTWNGVMTADPRYLCSSWASCYVCCTTQITSLYFRLPQQGYSLAGGGGAPASLWEV